jgi:hypothetical protein
MNEIDKKKVLLSAPPSLVAWLLKQRPTRTVADKLMPYAIGRMHAWNFTARHEAIYHIT